MIGGALFFVCLLGHRIIPWLPRSPNKRSSPGHIHTVPGSDLPLKKRIQIARRYTNHLTVKHGINIVRSAFERTNCKFSVFHCCQQRTGDCRFSTAALGAASTIPLCNIVLSSLCHRQHTDIYGVLSLHQMIGSHGFCPADLHLYDFCLHFPAASSVI